MTKADKENRIKELGIGIIFTMLKLRQETDVVKRIQLGFIGMSQSHQIRLIQSQPVKGRIV